VDGLLLFSLMVIFVVTLVASAPRLGERPVNLIPFHSISQLLSSSVDATIPVRNIILNVLLFVPFGFFFALRERALNPLPRTALAGLCVAVAVETIQFVVLRGRVVDVDDVLLNVIGTVCGAGAFVVLARLRARSS
jgi:glycopeptide antibiotics resistance protein